jgi:hypothetical protein
MTDEESQLICGQNCNPVSLSYSQTLKPRSTVPGSRVEFTVGTRPATVHHCWANTSIGESGAETVKEVTRHRIDAPRFVRLTASAQLPSGASAAMRRQTLMADAPARRRNLTSSLWRFAVLPIILSDSRMFSRFRNPDAFYHSTCCQQSVKLYSLFHLEPRRTRLCELQGLC